MLRKYILIIFLVNAVSGCASSYKYTSFGKDYRKVNSRNALLGSIGIRTDLDKSSGYQSQMSNYLPSDNKIEIETTMELEFESSDKKVLNYFNIGIKELLELAAKYTNTKQKKFAITESVIPNLIDLVKELRKLAEQDQLFYEYLINPNTRVITQILAVHNYNASMSTNLETEFDIFLLSKLTDSFNLNASWKSENKMNFRKHITVGYLYSKLCWNDNGELHTLVVDLEGNERCPPNTSFTHPNIRRLNIKTAESATSNAPVNIETSKRLQPTPQIINELGNQSLWTSVYLGSREAFSILRNWQESVTVLDLRKLINAEIARVEDSYRTDIMRINIDNWRLICKPHVNCTAGFVRPSGYNASNVISHLSAKRRVDERAKAASILRNIKSSPDKNKIDKKLLFEKLIYHMSNKESSLCVSKLAFETYKDLTGYSSDLVFDFEGAANHWQKNKDAILKSDF